MAFQLPGYLKRYLDTKGRIPFENYTNNSTYYSQLDYYWINYMEYVVRPCIAYGSGSVDGVHNNALSSGTGLAIVNGATRVCRGEKIFFEGDDYTCEKFGGAWSSHSNFHRFLDRAIRFTLLCGSCPIKIDKDGFDRYSLSAVRLDRSLITCDDAGNVTHAVFFVSALANLKRDMGEQIEYWLVEERKYNEEYVPVITYKVFRKSGVANAPVLPSPDVAGVDFKNLPPRVQNQLLRMGVRDLNVEKELPYSDLGVYLCTRTGVNSVVPDSPFGDPLLYGLLDLLWSIDVVYSGSMIDVLNGEGKILVPKQFLQETLNRLQAQNPNTAFTVTTAELDGYKDESFVYVMPSSFDKDRMTPQPVQFEIRADQYRLMWELYQKEAAVRAGFSPTSIFPHLTPDNSAKTATEVTAEENLTRASVRQFHGMFLPVINRALREIARLEGLSDNIELKLSDYIGNKMQSDQNMRENYAAGLVPKEIAVQAINNTTIRETQEYLTKIADDKESEMEAAFNERNYFGQVESAGFEDRGSGDEAEDPDPSGSLSPDVKVTDPKDGRADYSKRAG